MGRCDITTYDEHVVKDLGELFKRHPKLFFKFLAPGTKRYRGSKEEIFENIKRLGLEDTYGLHEDGIEIKGQDLYRKGIALQDIYRADLIHSETLDGLNRYDALSESGRYLRKVHDEYGGVGEILVSDIIFRANEEGVLSEPKLNIPDIVFNKDKDIGDKEKKATDILDFIINVGAEEFRVAEGDLASVKEAMTKVLDAYNDKDVIKLVKSYIKRGRLTLSGDRGSRAVNIPQETFTTKNRGLFSKHNEARVVNNKSLESSLKNIGLEVCAELSRGE